MKKTVENESCHAEQQMADENGSPLLSMKADMGKIKKVWQQEKTFTLACQREKLLSMMLEDMAIIRKYIQELWELKKTLKECYKKRKRSNTYV